MIDYAIRIKKNGKFICTLGGDNMNYDNVIWLELIKLVSVVKKGLYTKQQLLDYLTKETDYFLEIIDDDEKTAILDLDKGTIEVPALQFYKVEDVTMLNSFIELEKNNNDFYSIYEDGQKYLLKKIELNNVDLLEKRIMTFDEIQILYLILDDLMDCCDNEFIVNNRYLLRLSYI